MKKNFDQAFEWVIGHEGGYSDDRHDRGNWTTGTIGQGQLKGTKFGVSAMSYPDLDIANLTLEDAKAIYKRDYWDVVNGDELPAGVDYMAFDIAINHGPNDAVVFIQAAAGVTADGIYGPNTRRAVDNADPEALIPEIAYVRQFDYLSLGTWSRYGRGWTRRNMKTVLHATTLLSANTNTKPEADDGGGFWRKVS